MLTSVSRSLLLLCFSFFWIDKLVFLFCAVSHKNLVEIDKETTHNKAGNPNSNGGTFWHTKVTWTQSATLHPFRASVPPGEGRNLKRDLIFTEKIQNVAFLEGKLPLFQGKLGWWNIVISSDFWTIYVLYTYIVWVWPPFSRLQSSPEWHCIHLGNRWFCWLNRLICHDCLPGMGHTQYVITRNKWLKIHALLGLQHLQPYFWGL